VVTPDFLKLPQLTIQLNKREASEQQESEDRNPPANKEMGKPNGPTNKENLKTQYETKRNTRDEPFAMNFKDLPKHINLIVIFVSERKMKEFLPKQGRV